jgi:hypothetical protein
MIGAPWDFEILSDGLMRFKRSLWVLGWMRKNIPCWKCGAPLGRGDKAYRPLTNLSFRQQRICRQCVAGN